MTADGDVESVLRQRRSIRRFKETPVPQDIIRRVVEAATWAPSAGNRQLWEFTVVVSGAAKAEMARAVRERWAGLLAGGDANGIAGEMGKYSANFDWFDAAPVVVVVTARDPDAFLSQLLGDAAADVAGAKISAAMAAQNLMLAASELGLGTCCLTGPVAAQDELKRLTGLGQRQHIVCLIALGYPAETPVAPSRKPLDDVMRLIA